MSGAGIAAVVVTHESADTIGECLERLRAAEGVVRIRVVDNASGDATMAIVQRQAAADPRLRFIANPDNPGFGAACNQGVEAIDDPAVGWVALVNPDLMVEPDTLARMRALAQRESADDDDWRAGAAAPPAVLLGADLVGPDGVRDPAARRRDPDFGGMLRALLSGAGGGAAMMAIAPDDGLELQPVEAVSGALMLMPRGLYGQLGGFDAGYRLHAEDLDLCRRARDAGARVAVANRVRVLHVRGVSSRARPLFVEWHKHRGLARYFRRFEARRRALPVRAAVYAMIWARFPFAALRALLR